MQHIPISPLFAPRRPGHKSRVHTLYMYYIHRTAIAYMYAYHTESPLLCVWSTGAARGVRSRTIRSTG